LLKKGLINIPEDFSSLLFFLLVVQSPDVRSARTSAKSFDLAFNLLAVRRYAYPRKIDSAQPAVRLI